MIKCIDVLEGLKELENDSIDVVICDFPYNIGVDFGNNIDKKPIDEYVEWCLKCIGEFTRVMKPSATLFVYGFSEILCKVAAKVKLEFRWLVWHFKNRSSPSLKNCWQRAHDSILCCWRDKNLRIFNQDSVRIPYTTGFLRGAANKTRKATRGRFSPEGAKETIYKCNELGAAPRDCFAVEFDDFIEIPALAGGSGMVERMFLCDTCKKVYPNKELKIHRNQNHSIIQHPTQKPMKLTEKLLLSCKPKEGGKVLVPFVGSGSELVVIQGMGMEYVGFDINSSYIKLAQGTLDYYFAHNPSISPTIAPDLLDGRDDLLSI